MADESVLTQLATTSGDEIQGVAPPASKVVDWFHGKASTAHPEDLHHPLGFGPSSASPGDHTHDGKNSSFIIPVGTTLTDPPVGATVAQVRDAVAAINALLRTLGAG